MSWMEAIGRGIGGLLSPVIWEGSLIRGARLFHPDGVVYRAEVKPLTIGGDVGDIAQRLKGPALARLSGGIWRGRLSETLPEILGIALRFRSSDQVTESANPDDQDLLFLSFPHLWQLPVGPLFTNRHDFLANRYFAQLPFEVSGLGRVKFRLVPLQVAAVEGNRWQRLERAAAAGLAVLRLELRKVGETKAWTPVADITLHEAVALDQNKLQFNPYRTGRGIVPSGLLQSVRRAAYPASVLGRTLATRGNKEEEK